MNIDIRPSIKNLLPSATLLINERSQALETAGKTVYRLGFGQSPFPIPDKVVEALQKNAFQKDYLPVKGLPALREAVANYNRSVLNINCTFENVMIGPGSKELMYSLQMVSDAHLILPCPSWVSYGPQASIVQNRVVWVQTAYKNKWQLAPGELEKAIISHQDKPLILLLNYPSNPVGATYSKDDLQELAAVARKYDIAIISDEIYGELTFNRQHASMAEFYPEGTIVSSGLSKWCGAGGWRLGTFTFPDKYLYLLEALAVVASESFSSVSAPIQHAAVVAYQFDEDIKDYIRRCNMILKSVATYVYDKLQLAGVKVVPPEGGFYLFPDFSNYKDRLISREITTSVEFCEVLLAETGIALLPGEAFGRPSIEFTARLSYVDFDGQTALKNYDGSYSPDAEFIKQYCSRILAATDVLIDWLQKL